MNDAINRKVIKKINTSSKEPDDRRIDVQWKGRVLVAARHPRAAMFFGNRGKFK